jgi:hypothetical protein
VWDDLLSSMLPFPQICSIQNHPKLYHLTLQNSVSQNVPQTYLFLFPRNLCHIKWAVTFPSHFLWILSDIKLSDTFLSPLFQSSVWCTVLSFQRLIPSSYVKYHFSVSHFQNSVSYEIIQYLNNSIVSSGRPSHLRINFLSVYKHLNFALSLLFFLCISESDNFHL